MVVAKLERGSECRHRATEELVRKVNAAATARPTAEIVHDDEGEVNYLSELEKVLRNKFGRRVKIFCGKKTKRIEIEFSDDNDLQALLTQIGGDNLL